MINIVDEFSNEYGKLKVIKRAENASDGHAQWLCVCECGNQTIVQGNSLRQGNTRSCGCLRGSNVKYKASPPIEDLKNLDTGALCEKYDISQTTAWRYRNRAGIKGFGPPDPIELLSKTDKAYLAGLIDADGYIFIKSCRETTYPGVGVNQADFQALEWMADKLDATVAYRTQRRTNGQGYHRKQMIVRLHGSRAKLLCETILSYLKIKRQQAEVVLRFPCDMRGDGLDEETNQLRFELQKQIQRLNSRGKKDEQDQDRIS